MNKPHLIIVMEGGVVQDIVSDNPSFFDQVQIAVVDYDDEDYGDSKSQYVEQANGVRVLALVTPHEVNQATIPLPLILTDLDPEDNEI